MSLAAILGAATILTCPRARADAPSEKDQAERLFLRGKELMEAGKPEPACVAFEESLRHDKAGGTLLNLAACYETLHRYASAERALRDARALAVDAGRQDAAAFVDGRLAEISPKVDHLRVTPPPSPPDGLEVSLDGDTLASTEGGWEIAVDPGHHTIAARAPGRLPYGAEVEVEGGGARVGVVVPELVAPPADRTILRPRNPARAGQQIAGWSLGSVGLASLVAGTGLGIAALVEWDDAVTRCPETQCSDDAGLDAAARAGTLADGATLALGIGAASAALGIVLVLTAPAEESSVTVGFTPAGVSLGGRFQ